MEKYPDLHPEYLDDASYPKRVPIAKVDYYLYCGDHEPSIASTIQGNKALTDILAKVFSEIESNLVIQAVYGEHKIVIPMAEMSSQQIIDTCNTLTDDKYTIVNYCEISAYLFSRTQTPSIENIFANDGSQKLTPADIVDKLKHNAGVVPGQVTLTDLARTGVIVTNLNQELYLEEMLIDYASEEQKAEFLEIATADLHINLLKWDGTHRLPQTPDEILESVQHTRFIGPEERETNIALKSIAHSSEPVHKDNKDIGDIGDDDGVL